MTTVKQQVDSDREILRQNRRLAAAQQKEDAQANGETSNGHATDAPTETNVGKTEKKPKTKPLSKKMKKLLEQTNADNELRSVAEKNNSHVKPKGNSRFVPVLPFLTIFVSIFLTLISLCMFLQFDSSGSLTKRFVMKYVPIAYQIDALNVFAYLRRFANTLWIWDDAHKFGSGEPDEL